MSLPEIDNHFLSERNIPHDVVLDAGMVCVILLGWALPEGLNVPQTDVLIRLAAGYPDVAPDMWWCDPGVQRLDGVAIPATQVIEPHLGQTWQRWSRHFTQGQWKSGIDGLESYLTLIRAEFLLAAKGRAA
jgi:hypothetical protein